MDEGRMPQEDREPLRDAGLQLETGSPQIQIRRAHLRAAQGRAHLRKTAEAAGEETAGAVMMGFVHLLAMNQNMRGKDLNALPPTTEPGEAMDHRRLQDH